MNKIKATVIALVSTAFVIFGIWDMTIPVDEQTATTLIDAVFAVLGTLGITWAARAKVK